MTPRPLEDTVSFALARTCHLLRWRVHTLMHEAGLHRGQQFVLRALWEREGYTQSELAQQTRVSPPTITDMLQRMERDGLIERRHDTEDQRISRVYLTEEGWHVQQAAGAAWRRLEDEAFVGFKTEESVLLIDLLQRVRHNLTEAAEDGGGS